MLLATMSNSSLSEEASVSSGTRVQDFSCLNPILTAISPHHPQHHQQQKIKKKRNQPGNPDPDAEVIALSPTTLMATNRFVCEICNKGFQRDQNLQLHRRGHNLPWKLRQRNAKEMMRKRVYVCPEPSCVHHNPSRALGDLTGIKKHFCRKHGEKKWRCDKCSKRYAVQSDWKAHSKTCGTREYRCDCGTLFSRKDSFVTHRAFCDALAEESARLSNPFTPTTPTPHAPTQTITPTTTNHHHLILQQHQQQNPSSSPLFPLQTHFSSPLSITWDPLQNPNPNPNPVPIQIKPETQLPITIISPSYQDPPPLKQQQQHHHHHHHHHHVMQSSSPFNPHQLVTSFPPTRLEMDDGVFVGQMGAGISPEYLGYMSENMGTWQKSDRLTRDFLGLTGEISSLTGMDFAFDRDDHAVRKNNTTTAAAAAASFAFHSWADC